MRIICSTVAHVRKSLASEEVDGFGEYEPIAFEDSEDFGDSLELDGLALELEEEAEDDALPDLAAIGPTIDTDGTEWGAVAVEVAQGVLGVPEMASLELFLLRAQARRKALEIRIDQMEDRYGSASLEDIQAFSCAFADAMEARLGEQRAGEIETEVSSVGAERPVRLPGELERFQGLPMRVVFTKGADGGASAAVSDKVLQLLSVDHAIGSSEWALADVRANRAQGRAKLSSRASKERWTLPFSALQRVNLHLDM
ncbi:hypothetical protein WJX81_000824 [Elliptochloris bilobata]|uniref:DUF7912 domain-containing protein n=1 Tax=Elliptochloris bilobata TaxID=381761 RepID=A0AAW1R157_9CHLO